VAEALLGYYGEQGATVASELALLFEAERDFAHAADSFVMAAWSNSTKPTTQRSARTFTRNTLRQLLRNVTYLGPWSGSPECPTCWPAGVRLGGPHRPYGFRCSFNQTFRVDGEGGVAWPAWPVRRARELGI
jgi:hypothetical protein